MKFHLYLFVHEMLKIKLMNSLLTIYKNVKLFILDARLAFSSTPFSSKGETFPGLKLIGELLLLWKCAFQTHSRKSILCDSIPKRAGKPSLAETRTKACAFYWGCAQTQIQHLWSQVIAIRATCHRIFSSV